MASTMIGTVSGASDIHRVGGQLDGGTETRLLEPPRLASDLFCRGDVAGRLSFPGIHAEGARCRQRRSLISGRSPAHPVRRRTGSGDNARCMSCDSGHRCRRYPRPRRPEGGTRYGASAGSSGAKAWPGPLAYARWRLASAADAPGLLSTGIIFTPGQKVDPPACRTSSPLVPGAIGQKLPGFLRQANRQGSYDADGTTLNPTVWLASASGSRSPNQLSISTKFPAASR